jgi:adenine-specific DNA-methyltransferase
MRLDDIENAEAPKVEQYLGKIKVLRRIAHQLIAFLAQLEEFQKKLWLKKKFVTETNYCISLDRIPESFYAEIAANENQREEWVKLFAIDEIKADLAVQVAYSKPLKAEFLKANTFLLVDTGLFDEIFKSKILAEIADLDEQCDGVLIHSENYQALGMMQEKYEEQIECVYIDPPYNTAASEIIYKNEYKHSSWLTLVNDRLLSTKALMSSSANICATIDDVEVNEFCLVLDSIFSRENEIAIVPIRINPSGRPSEAGFALTHEYALFYRKTSKGKICRIPRTEDQLARFNESDEKGVFEFRNLRREGSNSDRVDGQRQYFPIYGDLSKRTVRVPSMTWNEGKREWEVHEEPLSNEVEVFPVNDDGREKNWRWSEENIRKDYSQFFG